MQVDDECSTHYHQYIGHPDKNMSNETPVTLYHGTHGLNISTYRTVHPTAVEYTFFVAAHRTSSKIKQFEAIKQINKYRRNWKFFLYLIR